MPGMTHPLNAEDLRALARTTPTPAGVCATCAPLKCPGWESMPAGFDDRLLARVGTLCTGEYEPTWLEHHPDGTTAWSANAPIAPAYHPYNRCEVFACTACRRPFLRYTEYGGYYEDARIREIAAALVVDAPPVAG